MKAIRIKKINSKKILNFVKGIPFVLGENAFSAFLGLIVISLLLGAFVFYTHYSLVKKEEITVTKKQLLFKIKTYEEVLEVWRKKEERLEQTNFKGYPNPFIF